MIDLGKIEHLEEIGKEEARLAAERESIPADAEYNKINLRIVYAVTRARALEREYGIGKMREYFLFVALYIFDPASIVRKMRKGLRRDLAEVLAVSENNVSHLTKHILFHFRHYKEFREETNQIYAAALDALK